MRVDFGKFMRICQLEKVLILIFPIFILISCAHNEDVAVVKPKEIKPNWLRVEKDFALRGIDDAYLVHPFFDLQNELTKESEIRYVVMTPENSKQEYKLDLLSGALYKVRNYCETEDVWETFSGKIFRPNFEMGAIPRVFDEAGEVQRIMIFKSKPEVSKFEYSIAHYQEARVLGSIVLEKCLSYPCATRERWSKSQILVGVNKDDPDYKDILNFADLKKKVDWDYAKAFLVNSFGSHQVGEKYFPAFRVTNELNLIETRRVFANSSKPIDIIAKMKERDNCIALYKDIWQKVLDVKNLKNSQQEGFYKFFKEFYAKDGKNFYECQKIVRPANINEDHERHWFFAFVSAFNILERAGLYYSCYEQGWAYNPRVDDKNFFVDQNKEINRCKARDFEKSFDSAINGMSLLRAQINKFFHYIEYDTQKGGSHQKIYSWIIDDAKKIPCEENQGNVEYFPQDVVWQSFKEDEAMTVH